MAITKIQSESLNLADTYDFTGTVTGAGGVNTPAFYAIASSAQTISNTTHTTLNFQNEKYDTDNAYDGTNTFTVPTGKGGKYFLYAQSGRSNWSSDRFIIKILDSGTPISTSESAINTVGYHTTNTMVVANLSAGDTVTVTGYQDTGSSRSLSSDRTVFMGYKIIE